MILFQSLFGPHSPTIERSHRSIEIDPRGNTGKSEQARLSDSGG